VKLGILVEGQEGLTWSRWRQLCSTVESLGFESLWRSDHLMSVHDSRRKSLETWVSLTVAALETRRLRFGSLVCPVTFRPPSVLAKMASDVDTLSDGRLTLGLGAGWNDLEHRAFGLPFPPPRERVDRLDEAAQVIALLLADQSATFAGRYYRLEGANPQPKSLQHPRLPLLIAGGGHRTLATVARHADDWDVSGGLSSDAYRAKNARLTELCREFGRDPHEVHRSVSTAYLIGQNDDDLRWRMRRLRQIIPTLAREQDADLPGILQTWSWRIGTPDRLASDLLSLARAGAQRVILQHTDLSDFDALQLLAEKVLPEVQETP
jgi:alkanesulfonate monooxygenase SsuD/methylene tetrahydromethanopterin reductase-like flavin-dependent oxidoreductase (luciferase family)